MESEIQIILLAERRQSGRPLTESWHYLFTVINHNSLDYKHTLKGGFQTPQLRHNLWAALVCYDHDRLKKFIRLACSHRQK